MTFEMMRAKIPEPSDAQISALIALIKDWQINHGSLLKLVKSEQEHSVLSYPVGVSVFPTAFPRIQFNRAVDLQPIYNELYATIAMNEDWLYERTKDLITVEPLARALWEIYQEAQMAGLAQGITAGIFRSDYMLHVDDCTQLGSKLPSDTTLKQVEFNAYSCSGGSHAKRVADMHRYIAHTGMYDMEEGSAYQNLDVGWLPKNDNIESLASCLSAAHNAYGIPKSKEARRTAVLFIVQPKNFNIADERPIEFALWNREKPVPAYRLNWGEDILKHTSITKNRELLFHPPWLPSQSPVEVSVVYLRAGYEAHEYDEAGRKARLRLEMSLAIKCPSILSHISTFKKVQQALAAPGAVEQFLPPHKAALVRETFVPVYPLDQTAAGLHGIKLATSKSSSNFILKPSLEGGGHNIYDGIPEFLASIPRSEWSSYILMARIRPPVSTNVLMGPAGVDGGDVVSELGILGTCLWRATTGKQCELLVNSLAGWTFKTKHADVDEMNVVKGLGCFDTPQLV